MGLSHAPLSVVCKAVAVMSEDLLLDAVPQAWELLLEYENEVSLFTYASYFLKCLVLSYSHQVKEPAWFV